MKYIVAIIAVVLGLGMAVANAQISTPPPVPSPTAIPTLAPTAIPTQPPPLPSPPLDWNVLAPAGLTFLVGVCGIAVWPLSLVVVVFLLRKYIPNLPSLIESIKAGSIEVIFRKKLQEISESAQSASLPSLDNKAVTIPVEGRVTLGGDVIVTRKTETGEDKENKSQKQDTLKEHTITANNIVTGQKIAIVVKSHDSELREIEQHLLEEAQRDPTSAITSAWDYIITSLNNIMSLEGSSYLRIAQYNIHGILQPLVAADLITKDASNVIVGLWALASTVIPKKRNKDVNYASAKDYVELTLRTYKLLLELEDFLKGLPKEERQRVFARRSSVQPDSVVSLGKNQQSAPKSDTLPKK